MPSLARSVPKPLKVPSLARSVPKPLKIPSIARSVPKPLLIELREAREHQPDRYEPLLIFAVDLLISWLWMRWVIIRPQLPKNGHFSGAVIVFYIKNLSFSGYFWWKKRLRAFLTRWRTFSVNFSNLPRYIMFY